MSWSDYEPKYIPKYEWMRLVFRWEKSLDQQKINEEFERKRLEALAEAEQERKNEEERQLTKDERERERLRKQHQEDRKIRTQLRREAREIERQREKRQREAQREAKKQREREEQEDLERVLGPMRRRVKVPTPIIPDRIEEVERHIAQCGLCQRADNPCKTAQALVNLLTK